MHDRERRQARRKYRMLAKNKSDAPVTGTRCPACGKLRFESRKTAKAWIRRLQGEGDAHSATMHIYRCGSFFHITSLPESRVTWYRENRKGQKAR